MTVREFLNMDIDIDVTDNVCEELFIAFVGPDHLTEKGEEYFKSVLDLSIDVDEENNIAIIDIDDDNWEEHLRYLNQLFYTFAGYVTETTYNEMVKSK